MAQKIRIIKHGIVASKPESPFGYFGWPTIARADDDTLYVVASGGRHAHICPWGRTILCKSIDDGDTWSEPIVINNTPIDDRDAGIVSLPGNRLAVTWFASNIKVYQDFYKNYFEPEYYERTQAIFAAWDDEMLAKSVGSWIRVSADGENWGEMREAPVNTPHGFIVLKDGSWLYLGKQWVKEKTEYGTAASGGTPIRAARSTDDGRTWQLLGEVPLLEGMSNSDMHEPHVVELEDGTLLGAIRDQGNAQKRQFRVLFTESHDGGATWSVVRNEDMDGSPPHLLRHSSGKIICTYGYRREPFGQRVAISSDNGKTWDKGLILRNDGPSGDLGYPATVELPNGDLFTIYYQQRQMGEKTSVLYTRWALCD